MDFGLDRFVELSVRQRNVTALQTKTCDWTAFVKYQLREIQSNAWNFTSVNNNNNNRSLNNIRISRLE